MAKITEIPTACPDCSGPIWDNTKRPKTNPKAPDAACKDKDGCRWAGWLDKPKPAGGGYPGGFRGQQAPRVLYTWDEFGKAYQRCRLIAEKVWKGTPVEKDPAALAAVTATLWIACKDMGLKVDAPKPAEPPRDTRRPRPNDEDRHEFDADDPGNNY